MVETEYERWLIYITMAKRLDDSGHFTIQTHRPEIYE